MTAKAWGSLVQGGSEFHDGDHDRQWYRDAWIGFVRSAPLEKSSSRKASKCDEEAIQYAFWKSASIVGFAPDETLLPTDLV